MSSMQGRGSSAYEKNDKSTWVKPHCKSDGQMSWIYEKKKFNFIIV